MFDSPPPCGDPHHCYIHVKNFIDTHCMYTNGEHPVLLCVQLQFLFDVLEPLLDFSSFQLLKLHWWRRRRAVLHAFALIFRTVSIKLCLCDNLQTGFS